MYQFFEHLLSIMKNICKTLTSLFIIPRSSGICRWSCLCHESCCCGDLHTVAGCRAWHWRVSGDGYQLAAATCTMAEHWTTGLAAKPLWNKQWHNLLHKDECTDTTKWTVHFITNHNATVTAYDQRMLDGICNIPPLNSNIRLMQIRKIAKMLQCHRLQKSTQKKRTKSHTLSFEKNSLSGFFWSRFASAVWHIWLKVAGRLT